ncbi:MAG: AAA family ATPase [Bacillota bacterium]|nr:AAA family ATPase [Bacillota bacterium]
MPFTRFFKQSLNVLIGANGAGKSNLISFFKLFNHLMSNNLQQHIASSGFGDAMLYYGAKRTPQISATLDFSTPAGKNVYHMRLVNGAQDALIFADEAISFTRNTAESTNPLVSLGAGHRESKLLEENLRTAQVIKSIMQRWRVYHFHDTSSEAKIKTQGYIHDNHYLRHDGGNLAAFLYQMKHNDEKYYQRIITTLKSVIPFFGEFVLAPSALNSERIILNWKEQGTDPDIIFGPNQLSDGTLRLMALITLLLQPQLPELIIIDEPELGLHPYAISVLVALLKTISRQTQIIVSTQSVTLIDQLEPKNIIVVDREKDQSIFRRLNEQELEAWLDEYSLGELWEKNVLGGRPAR